MFKSRQSNPIFIFSLLLIGVGCFIVFIAKEKQSILNPLNAKIQPARYWDIQAIDTMKYSRDIAREKMNDTSFDAIIDSQIKSIAETGATHVAISTPYDEEFIPFLKRWVAAARKYELNVWFRGNMSGWERWFDYPKISREEHTKQIESFILKNRDLFEDGDLFVSCPECENGGPGDPRMTGDAPAYRNFLTNEYAVVKAAFKKIDKDVQANYYSMNGDVARLIMDRETTAKLDGIIVVDHYVRTTDQLVKDIKGYAEQSGGKVILGEWGAPIPDIHGQMTEEEQAEWLEDALLKFLDEPSLVGMNYWTHTGSSTELWKGDGTAKKSVSILKKYYKPPLLAGNITDTKGRSLDGVKIESNHATSYSVRGYYELPVLTNHINTLTISKDGYITTTIEITPTDEKDLQREIKIEKEKKSFFDRFF